MTSNKSEGTTPAQPELTDADRIRAEICASVLGWDEPGTAERADLIRAYLEATLYERSRAPLLAEENEKLRAEVEQRYQDYCRDCEHPIRHRELLSERNQRWKPIEALPEDLRDGVERIYAIWNGTMFTSHTRTMNREWLVKHKIYTHYFELPARP